MGSSRALVCFIAFVLVLLSSASKDEHITEQREVTFHLAKIMQEIHQPDSFMLQREVDLTEIFNPEELPIEQVMMSPPKQFDTPSERGRPSFVPRSFAGPPMQLYPVQFPLGRPTSNNLQAICLNADHRPSYPDSYFPHSGFGRQRRRASAVNKAESWFSACCKGNQAWDREVTLCCATQAWELSLKLFCEEDSSVKDRLHDCCRVTGSHRLNCFNSEAPNPNYEPTEELPVPPPPSTANFNFDPNTCQRTVMTTHSVRGIRMRKVKKLSAPKKADISFPPGRPTADAIESLCRNQKLRPLYTVKCLPDTGYEWLAHQAKAINRIEKGFKQCCKKKKDVLTCADQKWRQELNRFCLGENGKEEDFNCCLGEGENERYNCFQNVSLDPHYNMSSTTKEVSLHQICGKIIKKIFPVGFPLKSFVNECCPLLTERDTTFCFMRKLEEMSELNLCSPKRAAHPAVRRCCHVSSRRAPKCLSKILTDAITKPTNVLHQKKKKKCPFAADPAGTGPFRETASSRGDLRSLTRNN